MFSQIGQDLVNDVRLLVYVQIRFHAPFFSLLYPLEHGMSNPHATSFKSILKTQGVAPNTDKSGAGEVWLKIQGRLYEGMSKFGYVLFVLAIDKDRKERPFVEKSSKVGQIYPSRSR